MGTNFYWIVDDDGRTARHRAHPKKRFPKAEGKNASDILPIVHIGKRSSAGPYCWKCHKSLCSDGWVHVHRSDDWWAACPTCLRLNPFLFHVRTEADLQALSSGLLRVHLSQPGSMKDVTMDFVRKHRELGFVRTACSFTSA